MKMENKVIFVGIISTILLYFGYLYRNNDISALFFFMTCILTFVGLPFAFLISQLKNNEVSD